MNSKPAYVPTPRLRRRGRRLMICKRAGLAVASIATCFAARSTRADTFTWTLGANGNWNVAANWTGQSSNHQVPGSADTASIASVIVSLTGNVFNVLGLNLNNAGLSTGTLNVSGATTFGNGSANLLDGVILNANGGGSTSTSSTFVVALQNSAALNVGSGQTLTLNNGYLDFRNGGGSVSGNVAFGVTSGGSLYFDGFNGNVNMATAYALGANATFSGHINNIGVGDYAYNGFNTTLTTAATFNLSNNGTTTTLGVPTGGSGSNYGVQTVNNSGIISAFNNNNLNIQASTFTNTGTVSQDSGTLTLGGTFDNTKGTLTTLDGGTLAVVNGTLLNGGNTSSLSNLFVSNGTLRGGTFNVGGTTTFGNGSGTLFDGVTVNANGGGSTSTSSTFVVALQNSAALNVGSGQTLTLNNGYLDFRNGGGSVSGNVAFGITTGGSLYFDGASTGNVNTITNYSLGSGATFSGHINNIGVGDYAYNGFNTTLTTAATFNLSNNGTTTTLGVPTGGSGSNYGVQTVNNSGIISAFNNNNLNIQASTFTNTGTVSQDSGTLTLGGTFNNTTGTLTTLDGGTLAVSGGTVLNSNNTSSLSNLFVSNGTLRGGTFNVGGTTTFGNGSGTLFDSATINANGGGSTSTSSGFAVRLQNGAALNVGSGQTLTLNNGYLAFKNTGTNTGGGSVSGNVAFDITTGGSLYFDGISGNTNSAAAYILGSGAIFSGRLNSIGVGDDQYNGFNTTLTTAATFNLSNNGTTTTLGVPTGGSGSNYGVQTVNNSGIISAFNNNNLNIQASTFTNTGTVSQDSGTLTLGGTFDNTKGTLTTLDGGTLAVSGGTVLNSNNTSSLSNLFVSNGTLRGGTFNVGGTTTFGNGSGTLFDSATINANGGGSTSTSSGFAVRLQNGAALNVGSGQTLTLNNGYLAFKNTGTNTGGGSVSGNVAFGVTSGGSLYFDGNASGNTNTATSYTLGSAGVFSGRLNSIGVGDDQYNGFNTTLTTAATFNLSNNGTTTTLGVPTGGSGSNYGVQTVNNSGIISAFNNNNLNIQASTFTNTGTVSQDSGTLTLGGTFNNTTGTLTTLDGGTLAVSGGTLVSTGNTSFLSNLFVSNGTLRGGTLNVSGATTFGNGSVNLFDGAIINATGGGSTSTSSGFAVRLQNSAALNVGSGQTLTLNNGYLAFKNTGSNTGGGSVSGNVAFGVTTGGSLYFDGSSTGNANIATTYALGANATFSGRLNSIGVGYDQYAGFNTTLNTAATFNLNNNGTTTTLGVPTGSSGSNYGVQTVNNSGSINVTDSNNLTVNANIFTNTGTVNVANGSATTFTTGARQTAGKTIVDGAATISSSNIFMVQGGRLEGNGTITGTVTNTGGVVTAGSDTSAGHLTETGNYTQGTNGAYLAKLGGTGQGTTYDLFSVNGTAALSGQLQVQLLNTFTPTVGQSFNILTYTNHTGAFDSIFSLDTAHSYTVTYTASTAILNIGPAVIPETGTLVSLGLLLTGGAFALRRKRAC